MKKHILILSLFLGVLAHAGDPAPAQTGFFRGSQGFSGLHAELWRYAGQSTGEFVLPIYYSIGLKNVAPGLALDVVTSPTLALQAGAATNTLFRVAGSKLRASYNFNNLFLATAGVQVPTGSNTLSQSEQSVAGAISTPQMAFKITDMQSGVNGSFSLASSIQVDDDLVVGAAVGGLVRSEFIPVKDAKAFNPGDELTATLGADYTLQLSGSRLTLMGEYLFSYYTWDRSGNIAFYHAAPRHGINLRADHKPVQGVRNLAALAFNLYGKNRQLVAGSITNKVRSDIFLLNDYLYFPAVRNMFPYALVTANVFTEGGSGTGKAVVGGLGGGGAWQMSRAMVIRGQAVLQGGAMNRTPLYGIELNGGVQYVF
ncbi:MAG: hypothetical protein MUF22_08125 [Chitinispirillaceae bacterium]|jgi:hypothetical protein|nr:hypothetical protein [Chitinispirillaceae bacterium]